jgi:predicted hydrolase (HD superfamily)
MKFTEAEQKLNEWVHSPSLLKHSHAVGLVMRKACARYGSDGEDTEDWAIAGLLHDADYELYSEEHPAHVVRWLRERGEERLAHAISAHGATWGVPHVSALDKALIACDELTGFIVACARVRPDGILSLTASSVIKKLKEPKFAAGVDRAEVQAGVRILGVDLVEHTDFIINALREHADELGLTGNSTGHSGMPATA